MRYEIRHGNLSDLPYVYDICVRTGLRGQDARGHLIDPWIVGHYFAAPYVVRHPDWTWILTRDGLPAGYLVATPDSKGFTEWMNETWLPPIRALYPEEGSVASVEFDKILRGIVRGTASFPDFTDSYPAHFHIDLLPEAQGQGYGTALVEAFFAQARTNGIAGFHLGVNMENEKALAFYAKMGMSEIQKKQGLVYIGMRFTV